jgi:hypothetical protein
MIRRWLCAATLVALTQSLGAGPSAEMSTAVRPFSALSVAERARLPDSTPVVVGKRTATLGVLRAEHLRRSSRIVAASGAANLVVRALAAGTIRNSVAGPVIFGNPGGTLVVEPASAYSGDMYGPYSNDVRTFCKAAHATLCLYYPSQTTFWLNQGTHDSEDNDPFITDASICTSEGGMMIDGNCDYIYPAEHTAQFNPGSGPPFTYKANCDPNYWKLTVDPHGAIVAKAGPTPLSAWNWSTGTSAVSCVVNAYIQT